LHRLAEPVAGDDKADNREENCQSGDDDGDAAEEAAARGLPRGLLRGEGCVGDHIGVGEMGEAHGELMASVNGGGGVLRDRVGLRFNLALELVAGLFRAGSGMMGTGLDGRAGKIGRCVRGGVLWDPCGMINKRASNKTDERASAISASGGWSYSIGK
jgi:hypothetical protein